VTLADGAKQVRQRLIPACGRQGTFKGGGELGRRDVPREELLRGRALPEKQGHEVLGGVGLTRGDEAEVLGESRVIDGHGRVSSANEHVELQVADGERAGLAVEKRHLELADRFTREGASGAEELQP